MPFRGSTVLLNEAGNLHVEAGDSGFADREVLVEEVAPVVLDIEEEAKDQRHVHEADEDDHHHPTVDRHLYSFPVF